MGDEKPMSLANALTGVRERQNARGRQPDGPEPMSVATCVRAMPSQAAKWRRAVGAARYRSANSFMCDAADIYADLLLAIAPATLAAGASPRDYARVVLAKACAVVEDAGVNSTSATRSLVATGDGGSK